jgi:hypothetical protein
MNTDNITVKQLRWILSHADNDATTGEALEEFADTKRREAEGIAHGAKLTAYSEYVTRRREREREAVQGAYDEAKQAAIAAAPISKERLHLESTEAADLERLRFEVREPQLTFEEWLDAGSPASTRFVVPSS